jgi:hypothetical protein
MSLPFPTNLAQPLPHDPHVPRAPSESLRAPSVRLVITAVERDDSEIVALHGLNGRRPWRLPVQDAVAAARSGRYKFEAEYQGERTRVDLDDGLVPRLRARNATHGDVFSVLPDACLQQG